MCKIIMNYYKDLLRLYHAFLKNLSLSVVLVVHTLMFLLLNVLEVSAAASAYTEAAEIG